MIRKATEVKKCNHCHGYINPGQMEEVDPTEHVVLHQECADAYIKAHFPAEKSRLLKPQTNYFQKS